MLAPLLASIIVSAFLHAFYNMLLRRSGGSVGFLVSMFAIAVVGAGLLSLVTGDIHHTPLQHLPRLAGAAFFYSAYQVLVAKCYQRGAVSALYPLTVLSHLFIPLWARLFLGERISTVTGLGIVVTILGALLVKLQALTWVEFKSMFRFSDDYHGARLALCASLMYSFGAVLDKSAVVSFPLSSYLLGLTLSIALMIPLMHRLLGQRIQLPTQRGTVLLGGAVLLLSFLSFRVALRHLPVSLAVPMRQIAIVFAMILGVTVLKEKLKASRVLGGLTVMVGVSLVALGAAR